MAVAALPQLVSGSDVFLDANVFVFALERTSPQCLDLLKRCASEDVYGVTTLDVVSDVTHRLMLAEACRLGVIRRQRANDLKARLDDVRILTDYWTRTEAVLEMNLVLVTTEEGQLREAQVVRSSHGLLTRDSLVVAAMRECGLSAIASNDADFDRVPGLTRYRPTDIPAPPSPTLASG